MEDACCKFEAFTGFITKDAKRGTTIETELKGDKRVENEVIDYCIESLCLIKLKKDGIY